MSSEVGCQLLELTKFTPESHDLDFILIPGIGTPGVNEWALLSEKWQREFRSLSTGVRFWEFRHGITLDARFGWQQLIDSGNELESQLIAFCDQNEADRRPIIIISHSLGGIILKQALNRLNVRASQNFQRFFRYLSQIAGVIFMSTPHGSSHCEQLTESCLFIVQHYAGGKVGRQLRANLKDTMTSSQGPSMISKRFDDTRVGIEILSIFENNSTKRKNYHPWQKQKHLVVVDRVLATTGVQKEELIGLATDHGGTSNLSDAVDTFHTEVHHWLTDAVDNAKNRVADSFRSYDIRNPTTPTMSIYTPSLKDYSEAEEERDDSKKAQKGSSTFDGDMNIILENFAPSTNILNLPCFMVDTFAQNQEFFGRREILDAMEAVLRPKEDLLASNEPGAINSCVLLGPGGFGKTEIAVQFVAQVREYFDAVFWIRAEDETKLDLDYRNIAIRLGLQKDGQAQDSVVTRSLVTEWLSNPRKVLNADEDRPSDRARWLLVFDNADRTEILNDYINIHGKGSILITSRDPNAGKLFWHSHPSKVVRIDKFSLHEGVEFLLHQSRQRPGPSGVDSNPCSEIVQYFDGHPLALAQIAGLIRHEYLSFTDIVRYIESPHERRRLLEHNYGIRETARGTIPEVIAIGMGKLPEESKSLLEFLCFLDPDRIQEHMLYTSELGSYHQARRPLLQSSFVRNNENKDELWMHRVDQLNVRARLDAHRTTKTLATVIGRVKYAWPVVEMRRRHTIERWPICEGLYPHVQALQSHFQEHKGTWPVEVETNMANLLQEAAWWQYERGNFKSAEPMAILAKSLYYGHIDVNDLRRKHLVSMVHDVLGCIANGTNNPAGSMENNEKFLSLRSQIASGSGKNDELLAYAHNQMGCSHMMKKDYKRGGDLFSEALNIWHGLDTYRPGDATMEYANLGLAYLLQGEVDKAHDVLNKGLRERIAGHGIDDTESFRPGRILYALGNVCAEQGHLDESEKFHQKALITFQRTIGNKYHRTADVSHKLAQHCLRRVVQQEDNRLDTALKLVDQAIEIWSVNTKAYMPEIARTTFLRAKILFAKGVQDESIANRAKAVSDYRTISRDWETEDDHITEANFDELVTFWSR